MNYCNRKFLFLSLLVGACVSVSGLLAQTGSVFDDFNRENTGAVTSATIPNPIGSHYVIVNGSWEIGDIGGNSYLQASSAGEMYDSRLETLRSSEYGFSISMDVLHPNYAAGASGRQAGVVLNYQDADNHYIIRWGNETEGTLGTIQIVRRENGSNTQLGARVEDLVLPGGWFPGHLAPPSKSLRRLLTPFRRRVRMILSIPAPLRILHLPMVTSDSIAQVVELSVSTIIP